MEQLCFPAEVFAEKATAKRSTTTGALVITVPKVDPSAPIMFGKTEQQEKGKEKKKGEWRIRQ